MSAIQKTPLYPIYQKYGAKTINFGGWELPVQFSSIKEEHQAVREQAGLFDVSHMGEVSITGKDAYSYLQKMVTNDLSRLSVGKALYTPMCYPDGGTVDDILIYQKAENQYLLVVNAANTEKDVEWLQKHKEGDVQISNISEQLAQLALQGPLAEKIAQSVCSFDLQQLSFFQFKDEVDLQGIRCLISRTGYTGEDGFEIYVKAEEAIPLWELLLNAGSKEGLLPCGLGARDTLRFEACLPLYGQELSAQISPLEARLGFAVKLDKEIEFIGQSKLKEQKQAGLGRKLVGIEMVDRGIPRHDYPLFLNGRLIGKVTSGTQSPTLNKSIGLALIEPSQADMGQELEVEIRNKRRKAVIVSIPFYKRVK